MDAKKKHGKTRIDRDINEYLRRKNWNKIHSYYNNNNNNNNSKQNNSPSEKELNQTNLNEIEDGEIPNDILNSSNKVISNLIN